MYVLGCLALVAVVQTRLQIPRNHDSHVYLCDLFDDAFDILACGIVPYSFCLFQRGEKLHERSRRDWIKYSSMLLELHLALVSCQIDATHQFSILKMLICTVCVWFVRNTQKSV